MLVEGIKQSPQDYDKAPEQLHQPPQDKAPGQLHRAQRAVIYSPLDITKSKSNNSEGYDCCQIRNEGVNFVPHPGVTRTITHLKHAKGISTFCPLDEKFDIALHNFRDENDVRLSCFVLPKDSTIPGLSFVYDRNYPSPEMARHVLMTPKEKEFDLNTYSEIGLCKHSVDE